MKQFSSALHYVHSKGIIHTDIKTENILIKANGVVTLIDFGCAIYDRDYHPPALGTLEYRSPEALLQCGWSYPTDIWSAGCVFAELLIGETLFPHGAFEDFHLLCIQTTLEQQIPRQMLSAASSHPNPANPITFISYTQGCPQLTPRRLDRSPSPHRAQPLRALVHDPGPLALLRRMLALQPAHRLTAAQLRDAIGHHPRQPARPTLTGPPSPYPAAPWSSSAPDPLGPVRLERAMSSPPTLPSPSPSPKLTASRIPPALALVEPFGPPPGPAPSPRLPSAPPPLHPALMGRRLGLHVLPARPVHDDGDSDGDAGRPALRPEQEPAPAARPNATAPDTATTAAAGTAAASEGAACKTGGGKGAAGGARLAGPGPGGLEAPAGGGASAWGTEGGRADSERKGRGRPEAEKAHVARMAEAGKRDRVQEVEKRGLGLHRDQHRDQAPSAARPKAGPHRVASMRMATCSEEEKRGLIGMVLGRGCLSRPCRACPASGALG